MVYYPDLYLWLLIEYENVILNLSFIPLGEGRDFPQVARDFLKSFPFFCQKVAQKLLNKTKRSFLLLSSFISSDAKICKLYKKSKFCANSQRN